MRHLIILLFLFISQPLFADPAKWQWFKDNGFELEFPSLPGHSSQKVNSENGIVDINLYLYQPDATAQNENLQYGAMTILFPGSLSISDDSAMTAKILRGAIDGGANNIQGKIISEKIISYKGFPGRDVLISFSTNGNPYTLSLNAFLIRNKVYLVQVASDAAKQNNISAKRFLHSFKLME